MSVSHELFSSHYTMQNKLRCVQLASTRGEQVSVIDADLDHNKVLILAESEPAEWTTEKPFVKVLSLDLNDEAQQMTVLQGEGLNDSHGSGLLYEHPIRLLLAGSEHFLLVSEKGIGALNTESKDGYCGELSTRAPVPFQIAVFHYSHNANLLHLLQAPEKDGLEYDLSVKSIQCYGKCVVAVLRWRESEGVRQILKGGAVAFMDGWSEANAVVWDWQSGEIVAQIPLEPVGRLRPSVKLISEYEVKINCSDNTHTAYIAAFDGQVHHDHHSGEASLQAVDRALQVAVSGTQDIPSRAMTDFPVFTARAVRLVHPAVLTGDTLGDTSAAVSLQRLHTLNQHTAIYGASLASDKTTRRLSRSSSLHRRFFLLSIDPTKLKALADDCDAQQYLYSLNTGHPDGDWPTELMATPQPFLRTLDDSLTRLQETPTRPVHVRSRSTSPAHSRHSSISSMWSEGYSGSEATGVQTPLTPVSDEEEEGKMTKIAFLPLDDENILQGKCKASEGHLVGYADGTLRIMQL